MRSGDRHQLILDFLLTHPFASVRDLQDHLGVSTSTIRRDIEELEERGAARKVYGGVAALEGAKRTPNYAKPYDQNRDLAAEAKRMIADMAATMIQDGDSVIIHGGSTCFHLGVRLAERNIRLFTNSMPLAAYLGEHGSCSVTLAGGELHREPRIIYSPSQKPEFYGSKFFIGAQALGPLGVLESHPLLVRSVQELSANADQIIVLADSRKFSIPARNVTLPLSRVGIVITDDGVSEATVRMLENAGVDVRIVPGHGADGTQAQ